MDRPISGSKVIVANLQEGDLQVPPGDSTSQAPDKDIPAQDATEVDDP